MSECCGYILYDEHTGDNVCESCGKIISTLPSPIITKDNNESICNLINEFIDIASNNQVSQCIIDRTLNLYNKGKQKGRSILISSFYKACVIEQVPRSIKEISDMFKINFSEILKYTGDYNIKPSDLSQRICNKLGITKYCHIKNIDAVSDGLFKYIFINSPPQSCLAVAILNSYPENAPPISIAKIANTCQVSLSCIRRLNRLYKVRKSNDLLLVENGNQAKNILSKR